MAKYHVLTAGFKMAVTTASLPKLPGTPNENLSRRQSEASIMGRSSSAASLTKGGGGHTPQSQHQRPTSQLGAASAQNLQSNNGSVYNMFFGGDPSSKSAEPAQSQDSTRLQTVGSTSLHEFEPLKDEPTEQNKIAERARKRQSRLGTSSHLAGIITISDSDRQVVMMSGVLSWLCPSSRRGSVFPMKKPQPVPFYFKIMDGYMHRFHIKPNKQEPADSVKSVASIHISNSRTWIIDSDSSPCLKQLRVVLVEDQEVHLLECDSEEELKKWKSAIDQVSRKWGAVQKVKLEHEVAYLRKQLGMLWEMCETGEVPPKIKKRMNDITTDMQVKDDLLADITAIQEQLGLQEIKEARSARLETFEIFPEVNEDQGDDSGDKVGDENNDNQAYADDNESTDTQVVDRQANIEKENTPQDADQAYAAKLKEQEISHEPVTSTPSEKQDSSAAEYSMNLTDQIQRRMSRRFSRKSSKTAKHNQRSPLSAQMENVDDDLHKRLSGGTTDETNSNAQNDTSSKSRASVSSSIHARSSIVANVSPKVEPSIPESSWLIESAAEEPLTESPSRKRISGISFTTIANIIRQSLPPPSSNSDSVVSPVQEEVAVPEPINDQADIEGASVAQVPVSNPVVADGSAISHDLQTGTSDIAPEVVPSKEVQEKIDPEQQSKPVTSKRSSEDASGLSKASARQSTTSQKQPETAGVVAGSAPEPTNEEQSALPQESDTQSSEAHIRHANIEGDDASDRESEYIAPDMEKYASTHGAPPRKNSIIIKSDVNRSSSLTAIHEQNASSLSNLKVKVLSTTFLMQVPEPSDLAQGNANAKVNGSGNLGSASSTKLVENPQNQDAEIERLVKDASQQTQDGIKQDGHGGDAASLTTALHSSQDKPSLDAAPQDEQANSKTQDDDDPAPSQLPSFPKPVYPQPGSASFKRKISIPMIVGTIMKNQKAPTLPASPSAKISFNTPTQSNLDGAEQLPPAPAPAISALPPAPTLPGPSSSDSAAPALAPKVKSRPALQLSTQIKLLHPIPASPLSATATSTVAPKLFQTNLETHQEVPPDQASLDAVPTTPSKTNAPILLKRVSLATVYTSNLIAPSMPSSSSTQAPAPQLTSAGIKGKIVIPIPAPKLPPPSTEKTSNDIQ